MSRKVLMATTQYWSSPFQVGSHHLARGFTRLGWEVAYISVPISPFHFLKPSAELEERHAIWKRGADDLLDGKLWSYVPMTLAAPYNVAVFKSEWVCRNWHKLSIPNLLSKVKSRGFGEVDLLYIDNPAHSFWLKEISYRKSVFRIADKNSGFPGFTQAADKVEREIARSVDRVLYTAESLKSHAEELGARHALYFPNGVDFQHFQKFSSTPPADISNIPRPIAIYVGAIAEWFHYDLLNRLTEKLPKVSFVLIGTDKMAKERLTKRSNLYILGKKSFNDLPNYLHHSDLGLIPFDTKNYGDLIHKVNPLKLYEYMACGLPVIATEWDELTRMQSPALLAKDEEKFISLVEQSISEKIEPAKFIQFASERDWRSRVKLLASELGF